MSDPQANPTATLDEMNIDDPADVNPEGQQDPDTAGDPEPTAEEAEAQVAEEERQKQSRFQRQRTTYEQKLSDKDRELSYWRDLALKEGKAQPTQQEPQGDPEPTLADFDGQGLDSYVQAHAQWTRKQVMNEARTAAARELEVQKFNTTLQTRVEATKKELKDWEEVIAGSEVAALAETQNFLIDSEIGPKMAYHLAKHPEEHERLNKLSPMRRIAELGKLEDKLSAKPGATSRQTTAAPSKLSQVNGNAVVRTDRKAAAATGSYATWKAAKTATK